MAAIDIYK